MPTKRELESLQEKFGRYSIAQAKQHNAARKTMKGYPHIEVGPLLPPSDKCGKHDADGYYVLPNGRKVDCLCRYLNREPLQKEIETEYNHQSL